MQIQLEQIIYLCGNADENNPYKLTSVYLNHPFIQRELLEDGTLLHNISIELSEDFVIEDSLNIQLFDLNYQNIGDKTFYIPEESLTQVDYTININK